MKIFYDCSREIERWMFHSSFNQIVYILFPQHTVYNNFSTTQSWIKQILILWPCTNSVHPRILSKAPGTPAPSLPTRPHWDESGNIKSYFLRFISVKLIWFLTFFNHLPSLIVVLERAILYSCCTLCMQFFLYSWSHGAFFLGLQHGL